MYKLIKGIKPDMKTGQKNSINRHIKWRKQEKIYREKRKKERKKERKKNGER